MVTFGEFEVDPEQRVVRRAGSPIQLQDKALELLVALSRRPGAVVTLDELHAELWPGSAVSEHSLRQATHRLRAALGDRDATLVQTVRGQGLRLAARTVPDPAVRLPRWPTRYIGRQQAVAELGGWLADPGVVTVVGAGGIGKSRLAAEALRSSPVPVWFCALDDLGAVDAALTEVAQTLGALGAADDDALGRVIAGRGRCTIVLDGVERLVGGLAPIVARWRAAAPTATFLVTSREPLRLAGERLFRVAPLSPEDGLAMLMERASLVSPVTVDPGSAGELVARLDGLPLAIELAAARLSAMSAADLKARLAELLAWRAPSSEETPRHATLEAVFAWSWDLLDAPERSAIGQCTLFQGRFTLAAAEDVVRVPDQLTSELLLRLVNRSWLQVEHDAAAATWYRMLGAVRAFVASRASGLEEAALRRSHHFAALGHRHRSTLHAPPAPMLADFVATMRHGVALDDPDLVVGAALGAASALFRHGPIGAAAEILREALRVRPGDPWLLCRMAVLEAERAHSGAALALAEQAVATAEGARDEPALCEAKQVLGILVRARDDDDRAEALLRESLALAVRTGDTRTEQQAWLELARMYQRDGRLEEAEAGAERVMALGARDPDLIRAEYAARIVLAQVAAARRNAAAARHQVRLAQALAAGDPRAESSVDRMACAVFLVLEDWEAAEPHGERGLASADALGQASSALYAALALAHVSFALGRNERGDALVSRVLASALAAEEPAAYAAALLMWVERTPMPDEEAVAHLERALALARAAKRTFSTRRIEAALSRRRPIAIGG